MRSRSIRDTFGYQSELAQAMTPDQLAALLGKCRKNYGSLTNWTDAWSGIATSMSLKAVKAATKANNGLKLEGIDTVTVPQPGVTLGQECVKAVERFFSQKHPDARLTFTSECKAKGYASKNLLPSLEAHHQCLRVYVWVSEGKRQWLEQVSKMFNPTAIVLEKGGQVAVESPSGARLYQGRNHKSGWINFLGIEFHRREAAEAFAKYREVCELPGIKIAKWKNEMLDSKSAVKAEHFWSLDCDSYRPGKSTPEDDMRLLESLGLSLRHGEIRYAWRLEGWEAWRSLERIPVEFKSDPWRQSPLFSFQTGTGGEALFQVVLTKAGKYRPWLRFSQESDIGPVHQALGLKASDRD